MADSQQSGDQAASIIQRLKRPAQVLVVSSVMFTFISYWRTAAVVLCDMSSTAYYIGAIVENAVGPAAPWFILAVMLFSSLVCLIYIESSALFVRGGVYRVVKAAMGGLLAKVAVSALMFDFMLTGPISAMSAGQYVMGLALDGVGLVAPSLQLGNGMEDILRRTGAVVISTLITLYFFRQNLLGIHESSGKALKIVAATTVMGVVVLAWAGFTLYLRGGPVNPVHYTPDLSPKVQFKSVKGTDPWTGRTQDMWQRDPQTGRLVVASNPDGSPKPRINEATGEQEDPLGFISRWFPSLAQKLRHPSDWFSLIGVIGLILAFGHSILAMSGEETLAQVYREVESPKLKNFKKAAFLVFAYSLILTASVSFLAVFLIPDEVRMRDYSDNLVGGLAMYVAGPPIARLALHVFVVVVGFLILSGAVNTAIIGSNGVLNRVAEDGVLPDWLLKPHRRYGTTHRVLYLILGMQLATIFISRGNMYVLGEAYAFGVVWSFLFNAASMVVLRFKDPSPREFKVPLNLRVGSVEIPVGLISIFLILLCTAVGNFFTKEVATVGGLTFTAVFLVVFTVSERYHERLRGKAAHKHLEQFNEQTTEEVTAVTLGLTRPYRKLVAIRSPQNLFMLEKTLTDTDPETTDVVVMTANLSPRGEGWTGQLDRYDQELMTAVVNRAEKVGKRVKPLIIPTNNPLFAVMSTAKAIQAQEVVLGASNKYTADEQLEQIAFFWISVCGGTSGPLTVHIFSPNRDVVFDLGGGNRIPTIGDRMARSVADLREAGLGVRRVLMVHYDNSESSDLFGATLTMIDPQIELAVIPVNLQAQSAAERRWLELDLERAEQLKREITVHGQVQNDAAAEVVRVIREGRFDLVILGLIRDLPADQPPVLDVNYLMREAPCRVCLVAPPGIPQEAIG